MAFKMFKAVTSLPPYHRDQGSATSILSWWGCTRS